MKQMNESNNDTDIKAAHKRLFPLMAFALSILICSGAMADTGNDSNNRIITAMYGFINTKYADPTPHQDEDYLSGLAQSVLGKSSGPDFSKESIYIESLVKSVNGTSQQNEPDFSNDDVYINHLVEIILK